MIKSTDKKDDKTNSNSGEVKSSLHTLELTSEREDEIIEQIVAQVKKIWFRSTHDVIINPSSTPKSYSWNVSFFALRFILRGI